MKTNGPTLIGNLLVQQSEKKTEFRPTMEDRSCARIITLSNRAVVGIYCVCDGHAGSEVANFLSENICDFMKDGLSAIENFSDLLEPEIIKKIIINSYANLEIRLEHDFGPELASGSTCAVVLSIPELGIFYCINCGDSSIFGLQFDSDTMAVKISRISLLHKPDEISESKRIKDAGGFVTHFSGIARLNSILAVSRSFGDLEFRDAGMTEIPDVHGPFKFAQSYMESNKDNYIGFLIMSDGITDFISEDSMQDLLAANWANRSQLASIICENTKSMDNASITSAFIP